MKWNYTTVILLAVDMIRCLVYISLVTVVDQIDVYCIPHPVRVSYLPRKTTKEDKIEYG